MILTVRGRGAGDRHGLRARSTRAVPTRALLTYQYLQMLPQLAQGEANKIFVIPSEFTQALGGLLELRLGNAVQTDKPPAGRRGDRAAEAAGPAGAAGRGQRRC